MPGLHATRFNLPAVAAIALCLASLTIPTTAQSANSADATSPRPRVVLLTDFTVPALNDRWRTRNDDVMGGRSLGQLQITSASDTAKDAAGLLTMSGRINTNGGGFTSVVMDLRPRSDADTDADPTTPAAARPLPDFTGLRGVRLRVRTSTDPFPRPYRLRLEDSVSRSVSVNFRGLITLNPTLPDDQWQTATVWLDHLRPTRRGRELDPADHAPLDPSRLTSLGIILNDTTAGPYQLQLDRIELIR